MDAMGRPTTDYEDRRQQFADEMRAARKRATRRARWEAVGEVTSALVDSAIEFVALTFAVFYVAKTIGHPLTYGNSAWLALWLVIGVVALRKAK